VTAVNRPLPKQGDTTELGTTAARAVLWNYASFASGKVLVLITMAVLARLLTPEDFGIVGFAVVAVAYLGMLKDMGLGAAVIQRRDDIEESAQTVYLLNLASGVILTTITALSAPLVARFFDEPLVTPILRVLAFTFVLEALGAIHIVLLKRNLDFRRKLIPDVGRAAVKGGVSIVAAVAGFGVWALVWGQIAGVMTGALLAWVVVPWRPRFEFHRRLMRPLLRFGVPLVITDIQYTIWLNLDYVIIGRMLGGVALGVYTLAYRLPELLIQSIWRVMAQAMFPVFSRIQDRSDLLRRGFLATIRYSQIIIVPLCVGLVITARPAVEVLFGDQWHAAIPVLQVMAVFSLVGSIGVNVGDVYKAIGRPDILAKLGVGEIVILVPALIAGAHYGGIVGVGWAHAAVALVDTCVRLVVARHFIGVGFRDVFEQMKPSLQAGAGLAVTALGALLITSGLAPLLQLLSTTLAGALAYLAVLYRTDRAAVRQMAAWLGLRRRAPVEETSP